MGFGEVYTGLVLGQDNHAAKAQTFQHKRKNISSKFDDMFLTLALSDQETRHRQSAAKIEVVHMVESEFNDFHQQANSSASAVSSFSNSSSFKRVDREFCDGGGGEETEAEAEADVELERICSRVSDEDGEDGSPRKKLRLTKQQSAVLEDSFKEHSTLNPKQKHELASQLNLRPRQVEVWFQNRRARTKLKQTEENCELLKKCCETLKEENKRLQKELQDLKSLNLKAASAVASPLYMPLQTATLSMCPCERICIGENNTSSSSSSNPLSISQNPHFFNPNFNNNPSAAC